MPLWPPTADPWLTQPRDEWLWMVSSSSTLPWGALCHWHILSLIPTLMEIPKLIWEGCGHQLTTWPSAPSCFESPVSNTKGNYSAASTWKPLLQPLAYPLRECNILEHSDHPERKVLRPVALPFKKSEIWFKIKIKINARRAGKARFIWVLSASITEAAMEGGTKIKEDISQTRDLHCAWQEK